LATEAGGGKTNLAMLAMTCCAEVTTKTTVERRTHFGGSGDTSAPRKGVGNGGGHDGGAGWLQRSRCGELGSMSSDSPRSLRGLLMGRIEG
jgi:hypothetical protein